MCGVAAPQIQGSWFNPEIRVLPSSKNSKSLQISPTCEWLWCPIQCVFHSHRISGASGIGSRSTKDKWTCNRMTYYFFEERADIRNRAYAFWALLNLNGFFRFASGHKHQGERTWLVGSAGEYLSAGREEQSSLFKAKRHQLHPPHQRPDVKQGSYSFGLARGYWIITDAFGVTVRPQVWRVLIIYLIVCMCWLINLREICRINYPIIPL